MKKSYKPEPDKTKIAEITAITLDILELRDTIAQLQSHLADLTAEERNKSQQTLPEKMKAIGLTSFTLEDGTKISFQHKVKASLSAARKLEGFTWLRENGFGDLIKPKIVEENVHPSTLAAFVREQLSKGTPLPTALFGVYEYDETVIK